jgi:hypothetical protein
MQQVFAVNKKIQFIKKATSKKIPAPRMSSCLPGFIIRGINVPDHRLSKIEDIEINNTNITMEKKTLVMDFAFSCPLFTR